VYHSRQALVLELPELEQRLSNLQSQVERLWRKAEASVPPIEQRLAAMADQYAEYLKRWAATVERHTQAVAQLEAYASEWKDANSRVRQETADRLQDLESTIEREWDHLKRMQEEPIRELREQAESLTQVSLAMANASQQGVDRAEARFASFESDVHLRLTELTRELQSALAEMKTRLDRHPASRDPSAPWSLDDVTRLHGQLRGDARATGEFPQTIEHQSLMPRELPPGVATLDSMPPLTTRADAIPGKWAAAVVVLGMAVVLAAFFGWRLQAQVKDATAKALIAQQKSDTALGDAVREREAARQEAEAERKAARAIAIRTQRTADVVSAPDLIRFNLSGADGASGHALFSRSRGFVVSASGLPSLPASSAYQVWLLTRGAPVKVGPLVADADGSGTLAEPTPIIPRSVVGVAVTPESDGAGDAPSGPPVLRSVIPTAAPSAPAAASAQPQ
jgi:hypothetical protein